MEVIGTMVVGLVILFCVLLLVRMFILNSMDEVERDVFDGKTMDQWMNERRKK
jgi:hypothetical protein